MSHLYQEASAVLQDLTKRGVPMPVGMSIRNGLIPASKSEALDPHLLNNGFGGGPYLFLPSSPVSTLPKS